MKKPLAALLALSLALPLAPAHAEESYTPVPDWAVSYYEHLKLSQIAPLSSGSITRGEFLDLLVSALSAALPVDVLDSIPAKDTDYFTDNYKNTYWADVMNRAATYGLTEGWVDENDGLRYGNFLATLTRQEAAKMVCTTLDFFTAQGYEVAVSADPAVYTDADAIPDWAAPYTSRVASYGIMRGDDLLNFNPTAQLDWPSTAVMVSRVLSLMQEGVENARTGVTLQSQLDWGKALNLPDYSVSKPLTGWSKGYYAIDNGDGTLSALVVPPARTTYENGDFVTTPPTEFYVERYDKTGAVAEQKVLPMELPIFGTFFDSGEHFYLAFGQENPTHDNSAEVFRVVQYDRDWNRLGSVSVSGKDCYTEEPFRSAVARMAVSADGKTVTLYAARKRYDGHQSNITIQMSTQPFAVKKVLGEEFPSNHVSHSFGQFAQYDGSTLVTVDHGDAYPRSFVLQAGSKKTDLLTIAGATGQNVTHAIGSGLEISDDGYLFLGCSTPQKSFDGEHDTPWNVFLTFTDKKLNKTTLTWLTSGDKTSIDTARLVKLSDDAFLAMWGQGNSVHYQRLNGKGEKSGSEGILFETAMPTTQPVVWADGTVAWIGVTPPETYAEGARAALYTLKVDF